MNNYCPECGNKLEELCVLHNYWIRCLKCSSCGDFLEIADSRWNYPLLRMETRVTKAILDADDILLKTAVERIKRIDYKTVSIVGFEHTLLGCYDSSRNYRIVYPDGSEK